MWYGCKRDLTPVAVGLGSTPGGRVRRPFLAMDVFLSLLNGVNLYLVGRNTLDASLGLPDAGALPPY